MPLAFVRKTRDTTRPNAVVTDRTVGEVTGKECILVNDMTNTVGMITEAINIFNNVGAKRVIVVAVHGTLFNPAAKRFSESSAAGVAVIDTLSIPTEKCFEQLTVLSIVLLLTRAIQEIFKDGSVTSLFD